MNCSHNGASLSFMFGSNSSFAWDVMQDCVFPLSDSVLMTASSSMMVGAII